MPRKDLYRLTDGDTAIIEKTIRENNINIFTNYYLRGPDSGTYWRHVSQVQIDKLKVKDSRARARQWRNGYDSLFTVWQHLNEPTYWGVDPMTSLGWRAYDPEEAEESISELQRIYHTIWTDMKHPEYPVFHHQHGVLLLDWQLKMARSQHPLQIVPGGFGCIAPETRIYDTELDAHIPVAQLVAENRAPMVLAWTGAAFTPVRATVPWVKGKADLYRVITQNDQHITVTMQHRFLTDNGWQTLSDCLTLGSNWQLITGHNQLDAIKHVEYLRADNFYDLHVPTYENYLAEGVINHNSGKTWAKSITMIVAAAITPGYFGLILTPFENQVRDIHRQIVNEIIEGTLFAERYLVKAPNKPRGIFIGNDRVGENQLAFFPILDGSDKVLSMTCDEALVDQAEKIDGVGGQTLDDVVRNVSSRFRGTVRGRPRKGQITFVANSADNPLLWDYYDEAEIDPEHTWAYSPSTFENTHLTIDDLIRYEKNIGKGDKESQRMYLFGGRPMGSGEHFPAASLALMRDQAADELMDKHLLTETPGWIRHEAPRVAVYQWERPYEEGEQYVVAVDPGWGNPPDRNAAAIGVWKITQFPAVPAHLVGFNWVFGHNSPNPWIAKYLEYIEKYHAIIHGFDSTGPQAGYERLTTIGELHPHSVSFSGNNKYVYLNLTKKFMADGYFRAPSSIIHLYNQCAKYRLPDTKLRQDIVMMLLVTSAMLEPMYRAAIHQESEDEPLPYDPVLFKN